MDVDSADSRDNRSPRYRTEIDGLRAVAVLPVVLFHAGFGFPGGFVGVDIFFVISGFLVTGIIARAIERGEFSIADFYCRRVRRIFPVSFVVSVTICLMAYRSSLPGDYVQVGNAAVAQNVFLSNVYFWFDGGYFSRDVLTKPFLHFWSLAVEEQFYLLFPALLLLLAAGASTKKRLAIAVLAIAILSFGMSIYGTRYHPSATFYLLPTRAWELMAGALLAVTGFGIAGRRLAETLALIGAGMIGVAFFAISESRAFPGFWAGLPVLGSTLLIASNTRHMTFVGRLLSLRGIAFVGLISYSLYLWHWPVFAFVRSLVLDPSAAVMIVSVFVSFSLAVVSWRWVEQPIRRRTILSSNRSLLIASGIAWMVMLAIPIAVIRSGGFPSRFGDAEKTLIQDATWNGNATSREVSDVANKRLPKLGVAGESERGPDFLLWGDSHAMTWTGVLDSTAATVGRRGVATLHGGTPPIPGLWRTGMPACRPFNDEVLKLIEGGAFKDVILVSRWSVYVEGYSDADPMTDGRSDDDVFLSDGDVASDTGDESLAAMKRQIVRLAKRLSEREIRIWLVRQVPVQRSRIAESAVRNMLLGYEANPIVPTSRASHQKQQSRIDSFYRVAEDALRGTGGGVIDLDDLFFDDVGEAIVVSGGRYLFKDDDHLSRSGAMRLAPSLRRLLEDAEDPVTRPVSGRWLPRSAPRSSFFEQNDGQAKTLVRDAFR